MPSSGQVRFPISVPECPSSLLHLRVTSLYVGARHRPRHRGSRHTLPISCRRAQGVRTTPETLSQLRGTCPTVPRGHVGGDALAKIKGIVLGLYKAAGLACAVFL